MNGKEELKQPTELERLIEMLSGHNNLLRNKIFDVLRKMNDNLTGEEPQEGSNDAQKDIQVSLMSRLNNEVDRYGHLVNSLSAELKRLSEVVPNN